MLTKSQRTQAIKRFARRYGYYAITVRHMTSLRQRAINEYLMEVLHAAPRFPYGNTDYPQAKEAR